MKFRITEPCEERWEGMAPRREGRYCENCETVVLDLSTMTRREAVRRLKREKGERVCVNLAFDRRGNVAFRPEPSRAPHWAGGLVLVAALGAGGCASTADASEPVEACAIEAPRDTAPMMPTDTAPMMPVSTEDELVTGPVSSASLEDEDGGPTPTAEQLELTRRKHAPAAVTRPDFHMMRGGMALRDF